LRNYNFKVSKSIIEGEMNPKRTFSRIIRRGFIRGKIGKKKCPRGGKIDGNSPRG